MWKAIACDFDGTMTDRSVGLNIEALTMVRRAEKKGVPVIISSGRSLVELKVIQRLVGASGPVVSENGGIVWNPETGEKLTLADPEKPRQAYTVFTSHLGSLEVFKPELRETDVALFGSRSSELQPLIDRENLEVHLLETGYLTHVTDSNVDKGKALVVAAEVLGVDACEVAAIGDSHNDVALFLASGAGFAVANADPRLKAVATYTMSRPSGAGCTEAIRLILKGA